MVWDAETTTDRDRKASAAPPVDEVTIGAQRNTTDARRGRTTLRTLGTRQTDNAQPSDTRDHLRCPSGVSARWNKQELVLTLSPSLIGSAMLINRSRMATTETWSRSTSLDHRRVRPR
jgi:hypothetical protein